MDEERQKRIRELLEKSGVMQDIKDMVQAFISYAIQEHNIEEALLYNAVDEENLINEIVRVNSEFFTDEEMSEIMDDDKKLGQVALMKFKQFLIVINDMVEFYVPRKIEYFLQSLGLVPKNIIN